MIIVPKFRHIEPDCPIVIPIGMRSRYRLQAVNRFSGRERWLTDWVRNTILTSGRNQMSTLTQWMTHGQVGTNNTAPNAAQTALLGHVAGTSVIHLNETGAESSAPYFGWRRITYEFPVGATAANLNEAGCGWGASGSTLASRVLIVDGMGTPITVTPLSDEILRLMYEMQYHPPASDVNGTIVLDGQTYDTIVRASEVTSVSSQAGGIGNKIGQVSSFNTDWQAYDGNLGTVEQAPSGNTAACDNADQFDKAYVNNSYQQDMQCNTGSTGWNLGAGIRSIRIKTTAGNFQTQFNNQVGGTTIPKTSSYTMSMVWRLTWQEVP